MLDKKRLLIDLFVKPETVNEITLSDWDLLIRQARQAGVLARLAIFLDELNLLNTVYEQPRNHLISSQIYSQQFSRSLEWEVLCIKKALDKKDIPLILLKGAAYMENNLNVAKGRLFSDVDILVEKTKLTKVEVLLVTEGWMPTIFNEYDQNYYRQWMHEIPPLKHTQRNTTIDVHHNIIPITTKYSPDSDLLLSNIIKIKDKDIWVLNYESQVIHSAVHLFHEGEFKNGFRDLLDLHLLIVDFSKQKDFWKKLVIRSRELEQQIPLLLALRYSSLFFKTPIPDTVFHAVKQEAKVGFFKIRYLDFLFKRALMPDHSSCNDGWTGFARWLLYIRSHFLRMPLYLLIPHLFRKGWVGYFGKKS